jgi:hypothetical protein
VNTFPLAGGPLLAYIFMVKEMELNWSAITLRKFARRISAIHSSIQLEFTPLSGQLEFGSLSGPYFREISSLQRTRSAAIPDGESSEESRREGLHIKSSLCLACLNIAAFFSPSEKAIRYPPKRSKEAPDLQHHFTVDELVDCSNTCPLCSLIVASLRETRPHLFYCAKAMLESREEVMQRQESMLEILKRKREVKEQQESMIKIWDSGKDRLCRKIETQQITVPSKWTIEELMWDALYRTARWLPHSPIRSCRRPVRSAACRPVRSAMPVSATEELLTSATEELLNEWCLKFKNSRIFDRSFILSDMAAAIHNLFKNNQPHPQFRTRFDRYYIGIQEIYGHNRVAELRVKRYRDTAEYSSLRIYSDSGTNYCNLNASKQH